MLMHNAVNLIDSIDKNAFIIEFDVNNIKGGIYTKFLSKKGLNKLSPATYKKNI